jgi:hypothetical protein
MLKETSFTGNCVGRLTVSPDFSRPKGGVVETVGKHSGLRSGLRSTITSIG